MKYTKKITLTTVLPALSFNVIGLISARLFLDLPSSFSYLLAFIIMSFLTFFILFFATSSKRSLFNTDISELDPESDRYISYIKKMGEIPLGTLALTFVFFTVSILCWTVYLNIRFDFQPGLISKFIGFMISVSMLSASFIYVLLDQMVMDYLLSFNLHFFPTNLKLERQKSKIIIIPLFMSLMTFFNVFFSIMLSLYKINETLSRENVISTILTYPLPIFLFFLVITVILTIMWAKNTSKLYKSINNRLDVMISSDKDLTQRIFISSVDELATVSNSVNQFSIIVSGHMKETEKMFEKLNSYQIDLFKQIKDSLESNDAIYKETTETILLAEEEDKQVNSTLGTGKSLILDVKEVAEGVGKQSQSISEASAAIEEMIASISEVTRRTDNVKQKTQDLVGIFNTGYENVNSTIKSVSGVAELSKGLISINSIISGIAARTNLLAMNAAIEAAHAGDAGRGFSVVADEIRNLAENTSKQTKTSSQNLKKILSEIDGSLKDAQQAGETFNLMNTEIKVIEDETTSMASSMEEHDTANKQVLEQLTLVKELTDHVNFIAERLQSQGESMMVDLKELEVKSHESLENAQSIKESNEHLAASISQLNELAEKTGAINERTMMLVHSFKVE